VGARLIAFGFLGVFAIAGLLCLAIALGSAVQRAALIHSGLRAEGSVIAKREVGRLRGGARAYAPIVQFTANDGRLYSVTSDFAGPEAAYRFGEHLRVLYQAGHPERARIDAFAPLWTLPLVTGALGAAFSFLPALLLVNWRRRRAASAS
jgi:hypothetical protein